MPASPYEMKVIEQRLEQCDGEARALRRDILIGVLVLFAIQLAWVGYHRASARKALALEEADKGRAAVKAAARTSEQARQLATALQTARGKLNALLADKRLELHALMDPVLAAAFGEKTDPVLLLKYGIGPEKQARLKAVTDLKQKYKAVEETISVHILPVWAARMKVDVRKVQAEFLAALPDLGKEGAADPACRCLADALAKAKEAITKWSVETPRVAGLWEHNGKEAVFQGFSARLEKASGGATEAALAVLADNAAANALARERGEAALQAAAAKEADYQRALDGLKGYANPLPLVAFRPEDLVAVLPLLLAGVALWLVFRFLALQSEHARLLELQKARLEPGTTLDPALAEAAFFGLRPSWLVALALLAVPAAVILFDLIFLARAATAEEGYGSYLAAWLGLCLLAVGTCLAPPWSSTPRQSP